MADRNEQVMQMVRDELARNPEVELDALYDKARDIDPSIGDLNRRQFHARYPLQVKRGQPKEAAESRARPGRKRAATQAAGNPAPQGRRSRRRTAAHPNREAIRGVFLEFASEFAQARTRSELVQLLGNVDEYVERVERLTSRKRA